MFHLNFFHHLRPTIEVKQQRLSMECFAMRRGGVPSEKMQSKMDEHGTFIGDII